MVYETSYSTVLAETHPNHAAPFVPKVLEYAEERDHDGREEDREEAQVYEVVCDGLP